MDEIGLRTTDPLRPVAEAWIDRWHALGGGFGWSYTPDMKRDRVMRSIPMPYTWTPPTKQNPALEPHQWITEERDHAGAVKVLDALLALVPGLSDAVFRIVRETGLVAAAEDDEQGEAA